MKKFLLCVSVILALCSSANEAYAQAKTSDSLALADLYNNNYGAYLWTHKWNLSTPVNTWYGVTLNDAGRVVQLSLPSNGVITFGSLPASFAGLTALTALNLHGNSLQGSILEPVSNLSALTYLDIGSNNIQDTIPNSIGNLVNLAYLNIGTNYFKGDIPVSMGSLTKLTYLNISNNRLSDTLPNALGNLTKLTYLDAGRNQLSGIIPNGMKSMSLLDTLRLNDNQISGIDPYIAFLSSLTYLDLSHNQLSSLPQLVGNFSSLTHLDINNNPFSGVPSFQGFIYALRELHQLTYLNFRNDNLSGTIPVGLDTLHTLDTHLLDSNRFTFDGMEQLVNASYPYLSYTPQLEMLPLIPGNGTISVNAGGALVNDTFKLYRNNILFQTQAGDSAFKLTQNGIYYISVTNKIANQLILQSVPDTFITGNRMNDSLALVALYDSTGGPNWTHTWNLTKPMSTWYGVTLNNDRVVELDLDPNHLVGTLPAAIDSLTYLNALNLNNTGDATNNITGRFPYIGDLTNLTYLLLQGDSAIIDTIPSDWAKLTNLNYLLLGGDHVNGSLSATIDSLISIKELLLNDNNFTGSIPAYWGNLSHLQYLYLNDNQLTGSIPPELGDADSLQYILLSGNNLTGSIPAELGNLRNLVWLDLTSNQLTGSIPTTLGNLGNLGYLSLQKNHLSETIPASLTQLHHLNTMYLSRNNLTFDGMEAIAAADSFAYYAPQYAVPLNYDSTQKTLSVYAGGTLANDTFHLYRGNTLVATQTGDSIFTHITDAGNYYITVTDGMASQLTLYSDTLHVSLLPVTLLSFTGKVDGNKILLQWQTATEINNNHFDVEHSTDDKTFTNIGTVAGNGTSSQPHDYSFTDNEPSLNQINYYRLKQVDNDGAFIYSGVISIPFNKTQFILAYPNPAKDYITIHVANNAELNVYSASGVLVKQINVQAGNNSIDIRNLSPGIYYIKDAKGTSAKFMKE